jgi:hypothetical protein
MKKSQSTKDKSASELIDARVEELGDWRGEMFVLTVHQKQPRPGQPG